MFNPLVIYGNAALGKSHLMQAIEIQFKKQFPEDSLIYQCRKVYQSVYQLGKNNTVSDFSNFYHNLDVLLLDDIQFLQENQEPKKSFFHLFVQLHQTGKQLF